MVKSYPKTMSGSTFLLQERSVLIPKAKHMSMVWAATGDMWMSEGRAKWPALPPEATGTSGPMLLPWLGPWSYHSQGLC